VTHPLSVRTRAVPSGLVIEIAGELDHHTAPRVRALLPGLVLAEGRQLLVDLGRLTSCDSSGIGALVAARNHTLAAQAGIALIAVPDHVRRVFAIVGLDRVFSIHPTVQAAESAWSPPVT
jgi:anti-sigma B factor antagonist